MTLQRPSEIIQQLFILKWVVQDVK